MLCMKQAVLYSIRRGEYIEASPRSEWFLVPIYMAHFYLMKIQSVVPGQVLDALLKEE